MTDNLMKGIEVDEDTLMVDEIHAVGPGGHFLETDQTLAHFRDFWYPNLLDRNIHEKWLASGATTLGQRLNTRVKEILKEHHPRPLAAAKKAGLKKILAQAAEQA